MTDSDLAAKDPPADRAPVASAAPRDRVLAYALRDLLQRRTGEPVSVLETHLSWVLLTRRVALKLKKAVRWAFVDYGSVERRHQCCLDELRLNRRYAPGLYRAVLAVQGSPDAPRLGGPGVPIDHVVCMRRFPDGALLSQRLMQGSGDALAWSRFARGLHELHRIAPIAAPELACAWPEQVLQAVLAVMKALRERGAAQQRVAPLREWVEDQGWALWAHWDRRRRGGAVRECHGDMHLGNLVMLGNRIVPFDAIEFDPALRWIDVMSDLAFTLMDLEARGRPDLGFGFLDAYLQASGDYAGVRVLRFYAVYRALVRLLASRLGPPANGPDYGAAAQRWASGAAPRLVIMHGLSGSGKSTVAQGLLQTAGAIRIRSDVERRRWAGTDDRRTAASPAPHSRRADRRTYARVARAACAALDAGFPVIVDAAFLRAGDRRHFETLARRRRVPFEILHCVVDDTVARERLAARARLGDDPSDATIAVWTAQKQAVEPLSAQELRRTTRITGTAGQLAEIAARWRAAGGTPVAA